MSDTCPKCGHEQLPGALHDNTWPGQCLCYMAQLNNALAKMVSDGAWQAALDKTVGTSGFKPDASTNPPKADACA